MSAAKCWVPIIKAFFLSCHSSANEYTDCIHRLAETECGKCEISEYVVQLQKLSMKPRVIDPTRKACLGNIFSAISIDNWSRIQALQVLIMEPMW